jgi:hypothetical protein
LSARGASRAGRRFVVNARSMGLRAGIDPTTLNKVADELEIDAALGGLVRRPHE